MMQNVRMFLQICANASCGDCTRCAAGIIFAPGGISSNVCIHAVRCDELQVAHGPGIGSARMPDLHVVHDCAEFRIVGKHVAGCVAGRIVAQERPHARLALLGGFNDGLNAVQNVVVKKAIQPTEVNSKTRVAHGNRVKRRR